MKTGNVFIKLDFTDSYNYYENSMCLKLFRGYPDLWFACLSGAL